MPALITAPAALAAREIPVDRSSLPNVAGDLEILLRDFLAILMRDVQQQNLPTARIEVRGTSDPEDDTTQILVRLWTDGLSDRETRRYQSEFGFRVDDWARSLSETGKQLLAEKISFQVRRATDA